MELATLKNDIYVDSLDGMTPNDYLPGSQELLNLLRKEGFLVALGSASRNSSKVLEQLQAKKYFDVIGRVPKASLPSSSSRPSRRR